MFCGHRFRHSACPALRLGKRFPMQDRKRRFRTRTARELWPGDTRTAHPARGVQGDYENICKQGRNAQGRLDMWNKALVWLGFRGQSHHHPHTHEPHGHAHTHGVIDPVIATTARGLWAIQWSFVILAVRAALQLGIVMLSGSVALLADTIHNIGDAATVVPLWIAFLFARRSASARFTYGFGRVEDLAGIVVVLIILFSAIVAGYEAVNRLMHPQPLALLGWVVAAGVVGFVGNEWVAMFRLRVGREIASAALIAHGYHPRPDGLPSLAVVVGALGVWLGLPAADPLIGLVITAMIFSIVWPSARAVFTRLL